MDYALFNTAGEAVQAEIRAAQATAQGGGGYGSPPQQYQAYRPSWVLESNICRIQEAIQQKRLQSVYPPDDPRIKEKAQRAAREVDELAAAWHAPRVLAVDIKKKLIHIGGTEAMGFEELAECSKKLQPIEQKVETYTEKNRTERWFTNDDGLLPRKRISPFEELHRRIFGKLPWWYEDPITPFDTDPNQKFINSTRLPELQPRKPPVDSNLNTYSWSERSDDLEDYRPDPWVINAILDATSPMRETQANRETNCDPFYGSGRPRLTSSPEDRWALLNRVHNALGFGDSQCRTWKYLCDDAGARSGAMWAQCNSNAESILKRAHRLVNNFSSGTLTTACLLGSIPHVAGAPLSPGEAMLAATHDIESFMDGLGSVLVAVAPVVIWLGTAARLWYISRWHTRELTHPVYSGVLATMAGFAYWAVRRAAEESASKEATILAVFMACWTSFVADSRRKVNNKKQYFLLVVLGGGTVCLLGTALQYIDQEPHQVGEHATAYLTLAKTNGPFLLIITSVIIYIWQSFAERGTE